eukprot:s1607_g2.t1
MAVEVPQIWAADAEDARRRPKTPKTPEDPEDARRRPKMPKGSEQMSRNQLQICCRMLSVASLITQELQFLILEKAVDCSRLQPLEWPHVAASDHVTYVTKSSSRSLASGRERPQVHAASDRKATASGCK